MAQTSEKFDTRVILFVYNPDDYDEEILAIKNAALKSIDRPELVFGIVRDPKIVKKMKQTTSWFQSFNSLVVKRYDGEFFSMDMLDSQAISQAYSWIHKKSIMEVEELSEPYLYIQGMIQ